MGSFCVSKCVCFCVGVLERFCVTSGRHFWRQFGTTFANNCVTQLLAPVSAPISAPLSAQSGYGCHHFWHHFWHRFWHTQSGKSHRSAEMRYIKPTKVPKMVPKVMPQAQLSGAKSGAKIKTRDVPKLVPKLQWVVPKQVPRHHFWHHFWHQNRCHNIGEPFFGHFCIGDLGHFCVTAGFFFSATRTPNSLNHSYVHYSLSKFTGEWFTNHSNHIHIFTPITRMVATMVRGLRTLVQSLIW